MATTRTATLPWEPVQALGVFMDLLSEIETASPTSAQFYDRLCEATCRLAHLSRAVIFLWDDARREVRAAGSRHVPLDVFSKTYVSTVNVPIARAALTGDCVIEAHERFEEHMPAELVAALRPRNLVCTPMSAGGLWFGILMGEREDDAMLSEAERHTLWTLGKVAALAASARIATRQQERARRLTERIDLARDVHDRVIQRLFGVGMVLGVDGELSDADRRRALEEVQEAVHELRAAMQRPLERVPPVSGRTLTETLAHLVAEHPDMGLRIDWADGIELPAEYEPVAQHVLAEAVRNARKHAHATIIDVAVSRDGPAFLLEVVNDGVPGGAPRRSGMGLRLAALEALHHGALVEFGPDDDGRWCVRLVMPAEDG
jgi:signal transduction histidine kinase